MKRWDISSMMAIGKKLFAKIHKQKRHTNPNHDVHLLAREIDDWLFLGIDALKRGTYTPCHSIRLYFKDEVVEQLHLVDRVLQHILLKQLKPVFPFIISPNCTHLKGPGGVKSATQKIKFTLKEKSYRYFIRADIKSFYKSISHHLLIQDINKHFDDEKVQSMLSEIIKNPIETNKGSINPDTGIALRGPLSQFFSALYLKPLDEAFDSMDVTYQRYQDDILVLCKSKRQLNRCKQKMMKVLKERRLSLSGKKTKIGALTNGFHFLGIHYPGTQPLDNTKLAKSHDSSKKAISNAHNCDTLAGGTQLMSHYPALSAIPHPRTLRRAREQVKSMVADGVSPKKIKDYLHRWAIWWVRTIDSWQYHELLEWFARACWDPKLVAFAAELMVINHSTRQGLGQRVDSKTRATH